MIPLYKPYMPELPELDEILHSGKLASGEYTKKFEKEIERFIGGTNTVLVTCSFSMAISVTMSLLEIRSGDEVIASPMACLASTQPLAAMGINVVWADVDPKTGTLCPDSVKSKLTSKTKAIIHNHFCGYPGYIDDINAIGKRYGIPVIDDGIEAFGSEYKGRKIGNCESDITIFSFGAVRIPNTIDGGAIVLRDSALIKKVEIIRDCGIDRSIFRDEMGEINSKCDISRIGYSATMSNVNAYIGVQQMDCVTDILSEQCKQAELWKARLQSFSNIEIMGRSETNPNYWVFGILADSKRQIITEFRDKGWYASGVHINNNVYSLFGKQGELLGVNEFYSHFVALPCGWWVQEETK